MVPESLVLAHSTRVLFFAGGWGFWRYHRLARWVEKIGEEERPQRCSIRSDSVLFDPMTTPDLRVILVC